MTPLNHVARLDGSDRLFKELLGRIDNRRSHCEDHFSKATLTLLGLHAFPPSD